MDIPHDRIRDREDRSWTAALVERLASADPVERDEVAHTLAVLEDPRAVAPLRALIVDPAAPDDVREAASQILREELLDEPDEVTLRAWWERGDEVLRAHALRSMEPPQADVLLAVAADPHHPLHRHAIEAMGIGFDAPAHQPLKIAALDHIDPDVRAAAAYALIVDEPRAAEEPLIRGLDDIVTAAARAAAQTLCWYRTRRALRALAGRSLLLAAAAHDEEALAYDFVDALRRLPEPARPALRRWLEPVEDLLVDALAEPDEDDEDPPLSRRESHLAEVVAVDRLLAALEAIDGPWAPASALVSAVRPELVEPIDRARLARAAVGHIDPRVRCASATWCGDWGDAASLRTLFTDPAFMVRKTAGWAFGLLPRDEALAPLLRAHLDAPGTTGTHASEVLRSYVIHAERDDAIALLTELVRHHDREGLVVTAVHQLISLEARDALTALMPRVAAPPLLTWTVHAGLLEAAHRLGLPAPDTEHLVDLDDLEVQLQLAALSVLT